ncbi:MAG: YigZ family protein [Methanobacteriaceae archaeon]|jgi:uncharacterized YigZ family protein|nr:YigZ family protein [Methanobacteriaceae archaeon]
MKTIEKPVKSEIKIKKSQFICRLYPAQTQKESKKIIGEISSKYSDATHNCTAYIVNDGEGYDDNGEPSGTAGKPMINALRKNNLHNIVAIVTRYFGGIKLGAGGLVRAYNKSVLEAINNSEIIEIDFYDVYEIIFDYSEIKEIEQALRNHKVNIINKRFDEKIHYEIISEEKENINKIKNKLKLKIRISFKDKRALKKI